MDSPKFRAACIEKLDNRGQSTCKGCQALELWKEAPNNGIFDDKISAGKKVLTEVLLTRLYIKRSGISYDQLRRDFSSGHKNRSRE